MAFGIREAMLVAMGLALTAPAAHAEGASKAASADPTPIGGYGELAYTRPGDETPVVDLRRFVLFVGHTFGERFRLYSEVEVEHAVASSGDQGEAEIEQAYLDYLGGDLWNLRGGLVLMPVGIVNQFHEPPTFNGVDRPLVDTEIIPSTWREPGVGLFGQLGEDLRYQVYLVDGFRATGFTAEGIREGHQEAMLARARSGAGVARIDWQPTNALDVGASGYLGSANQGELERGRGWLRLGEGDLRYERHGISARAELAYLSIADAGALSKQDEPPVPEAAYGLYAEAGYDLFHLLRPGGGQKLTAYARYQRVDGQFRVPEGFEGEAAGLRNVYEAGLSYRPISEIALKADVRRFVFPGAPESNANWFDLGLGWMF